MKKFFISYRRDDTKWQAKAVYDALARRVKHPKKNIFYDLDSMTVGRNFRKQIDASVAQCDAVIVMIGPEWLDTRDKSSGERRLDDPRDFVRVEIASALKRDIPVVPVLVDGVNVPSADHLPEDIRELSERHGVALHAESFEKDIDALVRGLLVQKQGEAPEAGGIKGWMVGAILAMLVLAGAGAAIGTGAISLPDFTPKSDENAKPSVADATPEKLAETAPTPTPSSDNTPKPVDVTEQPVIDAAPAREAEIAPAPVPTPTPSPRPTSSPAEIERAVKDLQTHLRALGFYTSVIDGDAGPGTQSAARRFGARYGVDAPEWDDAASISTVAEIAVIKVEDKITQLRQELAQVDTTAFTFSTKTTWQSLHSDYSVDAFEAAARQQDAMAALLLGRAFDDGLGVGQDYARARGLYIRACDGGLQQSWRSI